MDSRSSAAALCAALAAACFFAAGVVGKSPDALSAMPLGVAALLSSAALVFLGSSGAILTRQPTLVALGLERSRLGVGSVLVLAAATVGISHLADQSLRALGLRDGSVLEAIDVALGGAGGLSLATALLGVGIAPGFAEELLFRGLILGVLGRAFGTAAAIGLSALLFGVAHMDPAQGIAAMLLGLFLGLVAVVARSTWPAIACHVANNLVALIGAVWSVSPLGSGWGGQVLGALLACLGLGLLLGLRRNEAAGATFRTGSG